MNRRNFLKAAAAVLAAKRPLASADVAVGWAGVEQHRASTADGTLGRVMRLSRQFLMGRPQRVGPVMPPPEATIGPGCGMLGSWAGVAAPTCLQLITKSAGDAGTTLGREEDMHAPECLDPFADR